MIPSLMSNERARPAVPLPEIPRTKKLTRPSGYRELADFCPKTICPIWNPNWTMPV